MVRASESGRASPDALRKGGSHFMKLDWIGKPAPAVRRARRRCREASVDTAGRREAAIMRRNFGAGRLQRIVKGASGWSRGWAQRSYTPCGNRRAPWRATRGMIERQCDEVGAGRPAREAIPTGPVMPCRLLCFRSLHNPSDREHSPAHDIRHRTSGAASSEYPGMATDRAMGLRRLRPGMVNTSREFALPVTRQVQGTTRQGAVLSAVAGYRDRPSSFRRPP